MRDEAYVLFISYTLLRVCARENCIGIQIALARHIQKSDIDQIQYELYTLTHAHTVVDTRGLVRPSPPPFPFLDSRA